MAMPKPKPRDGDAGNKPGKSKAPAGSNRIGAVKKDADKANSGDGESVVQKYARRRRRKKIFSVVTAIFALVVVPTASYLVYLTYTGKWKFNVVSEDGKVDIKTAKDSLNELKTTAAEDLDMGKELALKYSEDLANYAKNWQAELDNKLKSYDDVLAEKRARAEESDKLKKIDDEKRLADEARKSKKNASAAPAKDVPQVAGVMTEDMVAAVTEDKKLGDASYAVNDINTDAYKSVDISEKKAEELKKTAKEGQAAKVFRLQEVPEYKTGREKYGQTVLKFREAQIGIKAVPKESGEKRTKELAALKGKFETVRDSFDESGRLFESAQRQALDNGAAKEQMFHIDELLDAYAKARNACVEQIVLIDREIGASSAPSKPVEVAVATKTEPEHTVTNVPAEGGDNTEPGAENRAEPVGAPPPSSSGDSSGNRIFKDSNFKEGQKYYDEGMKIYNATMAGPPNDRDNGYREALKVLNKADAAWTKVMNKYGDDTGYAKEYPAFDKKFSDLSFLIYACRKHESMDLGLNKRK